MSKSLKDLTYLVSSNAILKVLGIVSVMVYTRYLVKEELALMPFFMVMGRLSMVVFSFGILPTLVRDVPHLIEENRREEVHSYVITSLIIIVPGIFLFSILCYFLSEALSSYYFETKEYTSYLKLMAVGYFFSGINSSFAYIYWALSRFKQESNRMVIVGLIQFITGVVFIFLWGVIGLVVSLVISSIVNTIIYTINLRDVIFVSSFKITPVKKLITESMPFYLESYLMFFREQGDQLFVASILGPKALAVYFIARRPYDILSSFTQSLDQVLTTSLAKFKMNKQMFNNKVNDIITLNSYFLFPVILLGIGVCPTCIVLIAGKGYEEAIIPAMILLLWLIVQVSWKTALGKSIFVLKSSSGRFKVTLVETITLLAFMFILGYFFSLFGIVTGRLIATIFAGIYAYYLIRKDVSINIDVKSIAIIAFNGIIMCFLLLAAQSLFTNYVSLAVSFIFSIFLFLFLINRTVSEKYYDTLNSILPFKINDPFQYLLDKAKSLKRYKQQD